MKRGLLIVCILATVSSCWPTPPSGLAQTAPAARTQTPAASAEEAKDPVALIKDEGLNRSKVMDTLEYLTDVLGPRLTGSPGLKRANEWTRDTLTEWGLKNAHLEAWGPFGRGWTLKKFSAQVLEPQNIPLIAFPKAWSPGLQGTLVSEIILIDAKNVDELAKYKGQLKGKIVLSGEVKKLDAHFQGEARRHNEERLLELANAGEPGSVIRGQQTTPEDIAQRAFQAAKNAFFQEEGAALILEPSYNGDGGTVFLGAAAIPQPFTPGFFDNRISPWQTDAPAYLPQIAVSNEHFNRLVRMIRHGERLKAAIDLEVEFHTDDPMAYNTIAEIPGTDLKDEIVMIGAHLDSWHSGTGATDNGAGVAAMMEAVRILSALKLQPRRTIRIGLWTGEEQGIYGSRAYVAKHFGYYGDGSRRAQSWRTEGGPPPPFTKLPEYDKLSVYFNLDNGTGKIRGVYLQGNEAARPLFRSWLAPFRDMGASTLTLSNTGGTDHVPFDGVGLPGFQFIQDPIEYFSRTHHSNQDVFDRLQADDMKQASVIIAAFAYKAAMQDQMFPRKPLPTAAPAPGTGR